jgi:hypothetical protein
MRFIGVNTTTPVDTHVVATGTGTAVSSGPLTTTASNEILFGGAQIDNAPVVAANPPAFTLPFSGVSTPIGYLSAPTVGSYTFNVTAATSKPWSAIEIALKPQTQTITLLGSGTVTPRQPGFDSTQINNTSAEFPYNGFNAAPNTTLGAIEWDVPWSLMVHVDRLNWNRTGKLVLASKGDISLTSTGNWWELYLQMSGLASQLCFMRNGSGLGVNGTGALQVQNGICTKAGTYDAMPNGFNYNIIVTDNGTGSPSSAFTLSIDGLNGTQIPETNQGANHFGYATLTATGGTGYANSTPFISSGGGTNCSVTGTITAASGVMTGETFTTNYGCTSTPTIATIFSVTSALSMGNSCAVSLTSTSVSCSVTSVTAGSALIIATPPTVTNVTDTNGTPLLLAGTPGGDGPIWYEANVAAGTHTLTFTASASGNYSLQAVEVKGAAASSPIDVAAYGSGSGTAVSAGPLTTTAVSEFLLGFLQNTSGGGSGWNFPYPPYPSPAFTLCQVPGDAYNCATLQAPTIGNYTLSTVQSGSGSWLSQLVAIKPLITSYAPTGIGGTITPGLGGASMNSTAYPLLVPGYVSAGTYYGIDGTDSTQTPTYVDEAAIFPGVLNQTQIQSLFYQTKFYQGIANTATPKPVMVIDEDGFGDSDDVYCVQMGIGLHKAGLVTLAGVVSEDGAGSVAAAWRQMLDSAGLNNVPVSIPFPLPGTNVNPTALVTAYNASTPQTTGAYENSTTMYRTIFAQYPTTPIDIVMGAAPWADMAAFMQSPADSISALTGLQMIAQNGANGGVMYGQGALWDTTVNGAYVVAHNQSMPIIWIGGTPMNGGPGPLSTRTSNDLLWTWFNYEGTDVRQCYDCLMPEAAVSSLFTFGVPVTYSGGTGYANSTPFTLSGGGPNCKGSGFMTASGGIPNGIEFNWGATAVGVYSGIGSGCTSTPTVNLIGSIGAGVTLTATPNPCGQWTVNIGVSAAFSTATCANQYVVPGTFNTTQSPGPSGQVMTWFINSLVDPNPVGTPRAQ